MMKRALFALAATGLLAGATAHAQPAMDDDVLDHAEEICEIEGAAPLDAMVIDGRNFGTAAELAAALADAGAHAVVIAGGNFSGEDMRAIAPYLSGGCMTHAELEHTNWSGVEIPDVRFVASDLSDADMRGAQMPRAIFHGVALTRAKLAAAQMPQAQFIAAFVNTDMEGANFAGADLTGSRFTCGITVDQWCMNSYDASFAGADLSEADLSSFGIWDEEMMRGARFDSTMVAPRSLRYLTQAALEGPVILKAEYGDVVAEDPETPPPSTATITPQEMRALIVSTRSETADAASFDCTRAASTAEKLICGEWAMDLRDLDRDLAALYAEARAAGKVTVASQRAWLATRNRCSDEDCLRDSYAGRMDALFAALGDRLVLAPDQRVTYRENVLPLPDAMRDTPLYARILPVLAQASSMHITLTGMEDGSAGAEGFALGANAHMCNMEVYGATFDPANGWYSAEAEDGTRVPLFRVWRERLLLRYSGNLGDTPSEASNFIACGARASFGNLRNLGA